MARYFVQRAKRPTSEYWEAEPFRPHLSVCDHEPIDTGLVDLNGNPIMRAPRPVGFGRMEEW